MSRVGARRAILCRRSRWGGEPPTYRTFARYCRQRRQSSRQWQRARQASSFSLLTGYQEERCAHGFCAIHQALQVSSSMPRSAFFAPYSAADLAEIADLVVVDSRKGATTLVLVQPPTPNGG